MNEKRLCVFSRSGKMSQLQKQLKTLYISQPALTKRIGDIERKLGITLFYRTKHSVTLTPAGRILLDGYPKITTSFQNLMDKAKLANEGKIGTIRIGLQEGQNLDEDLVYELKRFKEKYPNIEVMIACHPYNQLLKMLETGEIDFGFSLYFDAADYNALEVKVIKEMESYIVVSADNEMCASDQMDFEELNNHTLLIVGSGVVSSGAWFVKNNAERITLIPRKSN